MARSIVRLTIPKEIVEQIGLLEVDGVQLSEPQPFDSYAEGLNAPMNPGDLILAAQVVTAIFTTGSAALVFIEKLQALLRRNDATIQITSSDGKRSVIVKTETNLDDMKVFLERV